MPTPVLNANSFGLPKTGGTQTQAASSDKAAKTMIDVVGGVANWYKLFPAKSGKWTQVFMPQIKQVEGGNAPALKGRLYTDRLGLQGQYTIAYYTGPRTSAGYAHVTRSGPGGIKLFAWYMRDADIARLLKAAMPDAHLPESKVAMQAQMLTMQGNIAKAKAALQGGKASPAVTPYKPSGIFTAPLSQQGPASSDSSFTPETANLGTVKKIAKPVANYAWYEVTPALILKLEKALPNKPAKAPIKLPQGPNFSAQLLEGPKTKWPYAKVTVSNAGQYLTLWFTIGLAGKNKPGSIIMLKRPSVSGKTPTVNADTGTAANSSGGDATGFTPITATLPKVDTDYIDTDTVYPGVAPQPVPTGGLIFPIVSVPPTLIDDTIPPGFGDVPLFEVGGENVEETPWYKSPLYIGAVIAAAIGGVWYWKTKK
jgi:hypothetical protein